MDVGVHGIPWSEARDGEQSQRNDLAPSAVDGTVLAAGAVDGGIHVIPETIDMPAFALGIIPPRVVDTLPSLPDADFVEGSLAFLTTDGKLYRNVADAWSAEVDGADVVGAVALAVEAATAALADAVAAAGITGQITGTQIADDAITTPKIFAGAVTTAELAALTILAGNIAAGAIETAKLAAGSVTAAKIEALTITAAQLAADSVIAGKIAAAAVSSDEIAAGSINTDHLRVGSRGIGAISNPGFEYDLDDWIASPDSGGTITVETNGANAKAGTKWLKIVNSTIGEGFTSSSIFEVPASATVSISVWARREASAATLALEINWFDENSLFISNTAGTGHSLTGTYAAYRSTLTAPSTARFGRVIIRNDTPSQTIRVDDVDVMIGGLYANGTGAVVIDNAGVTVTAGAITVTNSGGTVIIDGSSNIFKILASGTINVTGPNGSGALGALSTTVVDITLNLAYTPSFLGYYLTTDGYAYMSPFHQWNRTNGTATDGEVTDEEYVAVRTINATQTRVRAGWQSVFNQTAFDIDFRYYVLKEIAF